MTIAPNPAFLAPLIETLAATWPGGSDEERHDAARTALEALQPGDLIEAMLAARMIAAHHATMDGYRRAMQPDLGDADAVRLRNNAIAAARSFDAALRTLEKRRTPAPGPRPADKPTRPHRVAAKAQPPTPPPASDAESPAPLVVPHRRQFVPRDRSGNPIPLWRYEDMTMAQRRATYGDPDDVELQAAAIAEEEAMIEATRQGDGTDRSGEGSHQSP
jgi:hypothetical protein